MRLPAVSVHEYGKKQLKWLKDQNFSGLETSCLGIGGEGRWGTGGGGERGKGDGGRAGEVACSQIEWTTGTIYHEIHFTSDHFIDLTRDMLCGFMGRIILYDKWLV